MKRQLLTQAEFDSISTLEEALSYLQRFVKRPAGRRPIGAVLTTNTERVRRYRARKKGNQGEEQK